MKKAISIALVLVMVLGVLVGCSPSASSSTAEANPPANDTSTADKPPSPEYVMKLGTHLKVGSVGDVTSKDFANIISGLTDGRVKVDVYPGGQLGQEFEAAEAAMIGSMDMTYVSTVAYNDVVDGFAVDSLPFMFSDNEEFSYIFNESLAGKKLESNIIDRGARILAWIPLGFRQMYFTKKEVKSINEIAGMKMRAPESMLYLGMLRAIDSNPVTVTWGETYTALQTGVADGCECPYTSITDANMQDVVKYGLVTNHMILCQALIINEKLFQSFPEDIQQLILQAGKEAGGHAVERANMEDSKAKKILEDAGVIFHNLPNNEGDVLREKMQAVRKQWIGNNPAREEIVSMIMDAKAEYALKHK